ncbi:MAG: phospholipid carrier-dependent glycosyltransferase [Verrucomicrobiaceae bacterium]|nr:phospholipid carrier-dependent glycosyltransferase [Verrucomicrobiaceae bacterium]
MGFSTSNAQPATANTRLPAAAWLMAGAVLLVYVALLVLNGRDPLEGDELRYRDDVLRMQTAGFIDSAHPRLYNGPGLPLVLYPFVINDAPDWVMRLHAPLSVAAAALFLFLAARQFMPQRWALGVAGICSFHPSLMHQGWHLMPEPLAHLFMSIFLWCVIHAVQSARWWSKWHWGAMLAYFVLTMVRTVWGPVMMVTLLLGPLFMILPTWRKPARTLLLVMSGVMVLCVPFLHYTYVKTGRPLLWTSLTGELAYWMTSAEDGENGHWYSDDMVFNDPVLNARHGPYLREVYQKPQLECDQLMLHEAFRRAKANPSATAYNYLCNWCRFFFGFPRSLEHERVSTLVLLFYNGLLLAALAMGIVIALLRKQTLPIVLGLLLLPTMIYLGSNTLLSTQPRYFLGIMPIVVLLTFTLLSKARWSALLERAAENPQPVTSVS